MRDPLFSGPIPGDDVIELQGTRYSKSASTISARFDQKKTNQKTKDAAVRRIERIDQVAMPRKHALLGPSLAVPQ